MRPVASPRRPGRLAWLALSGLAAVATVLMGAAWVALRSESWQDAPERLVRACLLVSESAARGFWAWATAHPLTALALGILAGSLGWAVVRFSLSLWNGSPRGRQLDVYEPGRFLLLDQALRATPDVDPALVRVVRASRCGAFTAGLVHPKICLSVGLIESMTEGELQGVLRHELAHVRARDPLGLAAVRFLSDFLWFLPITRSFADAFLGQAEFQADEAAVVAGGDPVELASAIVKAAKGALLAPPLAPALGGLALVEQRVARLLGRDRTMATRIPLGRGVMSALMLVTLLLLLLAPGLAWEGASSPDLPAPTAHMRWMMSQGMSDCLEEARMQVPPGNWCPGRSSDV